MFYLVHMDSSTRHSADSTINRDTSNDNHNKKIETKDMKRMEAGIPLEDEFGKDEKEVTSPQTDVILVSWDGPNDPGNPRKFVIVPSFYQYLHFPSSWSRSKKWAATIVVSAYTFISPIASSMMSPAVPKIAENFGVTNSVIQSMLVSIFILAYGECAKNILLREY